MSDPSASLWDQIAGPGGPLDFSSSLAPYFVTSYPGDPNAFGSAQNNTASFAAAQATSNYLPVSGGQANAQAVNQVMLQYYQQNPTAAVNNTTVQPEAVPAGYGSPLGLSNFGLPTSLPSLSSIDPSILYAIGLILALVVLLVIVGALR